MLRALEHQRHVGRGLDSRPLDDAGRYHLFWLQGILPNRKCKIVHPNRVISVRSRRLPDAFP